jgi:tetratricopeptide (TPR) repeat protein
VHSRLGEWDYAVERVREYLKERPDHQDAMLLLAQGLVRQGKLDEAEQQLMGIPEESRGGEVLFALGRLEYGKGNLDASRQYLLAANEALPNHWEILQQLIVLDRIQERTPESKARVDAALEAEPERAKLHQLAAAVAFSEGRVEDAEAELRRAIELEPTDLSAYQRLARFYANTGRLEETTRTYEQALEVKPEAAQIHHFLGVLYELSGDPERAIQRYEDAIRYGPDLAEAKNNLAYIYADLDRDLDRALDLAQDAKAMLPDNPSVADTLGWVLYRRGVPSAAISYLKEAEAATDTNDASIGVVRYHLAQAYEANGETDAALAALDRSLGGLEAQMEAVRSGGGEPGPPPAWAEEARSMQERLSSAPS